MEDTVSPEQCSWKCAMARTVAPQQKRILGSSALLWGLLLVAPTQVMSSIGTSLLPGHREKTGGSWAMGWKWRITIVIRSTKVWRIALGKDSQPHVSLPFRMFFDIVTCHLPVMTWDLCSSSWRQVGPWLLWSIQCGGSDRYHATSKTRWRKETQALLCPVGHSFGTYGRNAI